MSLLRIPLLSSETAFSCRRSLPCILRSTLKLRMLKAVKISILMTMSPSVRFLLLAMELQFCW